MKKSLKQWVAVLLAGIFVIACAACGNNTPESYLSKVNEIYQEIQAEASKADNLEDGTEESFQQFVSLVESYTKSAKKLAKLSTPDEYKDAQEKFKEAADKFGQASDIMKDMTMEKISSDTTAASDYLTAVSSFTGGMSSLTEGMTLLDNSTSSLVSGN